MERLEAFFAPNSIAVIGASRDPEKLGYGVARNLIGSGYPGKVYLINPNGGELFGKKLVKSVNDLDQPVDLGLIVLSPNLVPDALSESSKKGIKNFIILSGGFKESGEEGAHIEKQCKQIAEKEQLRVMGPNCIGILDTNYPLDTTFIQPPMPKPGEVAFVTHSGALGAAMIDWAREEGFGFSQLISLGNQMDINESDVLFPIVQNPQTKVITLYLESIQDGMAFLREAEIAASIKPVLALKVGRTEAGKKAAYSHTGALAGSDSAYSAAFRRAGILRVERIEDLFRKAKALAWTSLPHGNKVAILTNAGGPGVTAADAIERYGLAAAELSQSTQDKLSDLLPQAASVGNPVDMLASASPEIYAQCLELLLDDQGVDMVLVIAPPPPMFKSLDIARELAGVVGQFSKPVVVALMGSYLVEEAVSFLDERKIAVYAFPEDGIVALVTLWNRAEILNRDRSLLAYKVSGENRRSVGQLLKGLKQKGGFVPMDTALEIARRYDLPLLEQVFASSPEKAAEVAAEIGYPVALKIAVKGISHKSDLGGVLLNLKSEEEVIEGYTTLSRTAARHLSKDYVFGVHIQRMVRAGQEVIVGAVRDPVFGPIVMFGSGGVDVEGLQDIQFAVAPLIKADLEYLINETWAGKKLMGFRGCQKADIEAVKETLTKVGQVMIDNQEITEIEINPLIVLEGEQGAYGVDFRMVVSPAKMSDRISLS